MIHYVIVSILVIISTLLIRTGLHRVNLLPAQASAEAKTVDWLFGVHIDLISFLFSLIVVFILYSLIVFRKKKGDESDGAFFEGNSTLEVIWTIVPLGIVLFLAFTGANSLADIERRDPDALKVDVIASQWSWRFEYPAYNIISNELYLPLNQQVLLRMQSTDVIHSFWVPEFRVKQDVLPGGKDFIRELRITPTQIGDFKVRCAELCGREHYAMVADVFVVSAEDFESWVEKAQAECDLGPVGCGERWAITYGCFSCHSVDGTTLVGPTWQGLFGSTVNLSDGTSVLADEDYLLESIIDPNAKIHEGFNAGVMPQTFGNTIPESDLNDIIEFIKNLQ